MNEVFNLSKIGSDDKLHCATVDDRLFHIAKTLQVDSRYPIQQHKYFLHNAHVSRYVVEGRAAKLDSSHARL